MSLIIGQYFVSSSTLETILQILSIGADISRVTLTWSISKGEDTFCAETGGTTLLSVRIVDVPVNTDTIVRTTVSVALVIEVVTTIQCLHYYY